MDIADVAYDYFLSNGEPETFVNAENGETVRLRVINGSATTYFHLNYSGGPMTIISADGQLAQPVEKDLFLIGVAETYDVIISIPDLVPANFVPPPTMVQVLPRHMRKCSRQ